MEKNVHVGLNKTASSLSPNLTKDMVEFANETPVSDVETPDFTEIRRAYATESSSIGTVPLPSSLTGGLKMAAKKIAGREPELLIDKLAERLAFERSGARLYEALLLKCEHAAPELDLERLKEIRREELQHFALVREVIESLGADPTAQTPCADISAVAGMGLIQVLNDPRTSVAQALNAILTAELTDTAGWELLIDIAAQSGVDEHTIARFEAAQQAESAHVLSIKEMLRQITLGEDLQ